MGTKGHPYRGVSLFVPLRWSGDRKGNVPFCPFWSPLTHRENSQRESQPRARIGSEEKCAQGNESVRKQKETKRWRTWRGSCRLVVLR
jgi:hypothetical protein